MNIEYPSELQRRFEQSIVDGRIAVTRTVTVGDLASEYQTSQGQMKQVMLTAHRKGLVDKVTQEDDAFQILELPTTSFASVFTHTASSGFKPRSVVRDVEIGPATLVVAEKLDMDEGSPVYTTEIQWAYNPLPLYYRSYESPMLGIEAPFMDCSFELVEGEAEIVPGVTVFPTTGHTPGHQSMQVETAAGSIVICGDAVFRYRNIEPRPEEHWRYWVQQRYVSMIDGWWSVEEIDRRADFILPGHDDAVLDHPVYPMRACPCVRSASLSQARPFTFPASEGRGGTDEREAYCHRRRHVGYQGS